MSSLVYEVDVMMPQAYAEWTTAYMNDLPDSAFLYIAPGGEKDDEGLTKPRSLRFFPYRDSKGDVDLPHLRNAIAQAPKANLSAAIIAKVQAKGRKILEAQQTAAAETEEERREREEEERREREEEEKRAAKKQARRTTPKGYGMPLGNPASRRYYSEDADWSAPVALAEGSAKWVEIARSGSHFGRGSDRKVKLSEADIESMARGYRKIQSEGWFATGAPVTYNHASVLGAKDAESTKAAGRILELKTQRRGDGSLALFGLIRWTEEARRRVRAGEFDGFSIEALPPASARSKEDGSPFGDWALTGGTLTNEPLISRLAPVAASETSTRSTPKMDATLSILRGALALSEDATEAEVIGAAQQLSERAAKADALEESLSTVTSDRDAIKAERDDLSSWKQDRMLDLACDEGRIAAAERERYARVVAALGESEANEIYYRGRLPTGEVGADAPLTPADAAGFAGVQSTIQALADRLGSDGLDAASAFARAMTEVLSDPVKLALYESETLN